MILKEGLLRCSFISNGTNMNQPKNCSHMTYSSSSNFRSKCNNSKCSNNSNSCCNNSKCSSSSSSSSRAALAMVEALNMEAKLQERKGKEGQ